MHHLKETTIDGVKYVLIPEDLHDQLAEYINNLSRMKFETAEFIHTQWKQYDPEVFDVL